MSSNENDNSKLSALYCEDAMIKCLRPYNIGTRTVSTNPLLSSDEAHLFTQLTYHAAGLVARQLKIATQHAVQLASPVTWQCVAQQNSTPDCRF